jgi:alpha-L-fucosidase
MRKKTILILAACVMLSTFPVYNAQAQTVPAASAMSETKEQRDARMKWWREARFGMFIHWGVYSVPAGVYEGRNIGGLGEWIMNSAKIPVVTYKEYAKQFNPVKYDPAAWVKLAKEAGMKYIIITSKHHDGFALFDSKVTDWDVVDATPYGKDLLKPLAEACQEHGLVLGFYYSQAQDWNHPGGAAAHGHWDPAQDGSMDEYISKIAVPQVKEILSNYGKIGVLWWDTPENMNRERADMLLPLLSLQPGIIWNNRLGAGYQGDTETPEGFIPATGYSEGRDWETCMTINNTWGYKSWDTNYKSTETLIRNLIDIASKGGNYLLNVGPTSEGLIPQPQIDRLLEMGKWLKVNGEAIYATGPNPFPRTPPAAPAQEPGARRGRRGRGRGAAMPWDWRATTKLNPDGSGKIYLHIFQWPEDGNFTVTSTYKAQLVKVYLLVDPKTAFEGNVTTEGDQTTFAIKLPAEAPDPIASVICLEVKP